MQHLTRVAHAHPSSFHSPYLTLSNIPMGPTDIRNTNARMISPTAVMSDKRQWYDDLPADRNPYNPENRSRILELMDAEFEP